MFNSILISIDTKAQPEENATFRGLLSLAYPKIKIALLFIKRTI
jgi:hypothetical protein